MVAFSLSILAGYGLNRLIKYRPKKEQIQIFLVCLAIVLLESHMFPLGLGLTPLGQNIPDVYKWLSNESGDFAVAELPMIYVDHIESGTDLYKNTKYMYYSTYHWKKLVNGYSGFTPDYHIGIIYILKTFPSNESIDLLQHFGVKYVIVHKEEIMPSTWNYIDNNIKNYQDNVRLIKVFDQDYVYEINLKQRALSPKSNVRAKAYVPTEMQIDNHYYGSIELVNEDSRDYIFEPNGRLSINVEINSSKKKISVKNSQIHLPLLIKAKTSLNIPFVIDSPSSECEYTIQVIISGLDLIDREVFKGDVFLEKYVLDSASSKNVSGELIVDEFPALIRTGETFKVHMIAKNSGTVLWRSKVSTSSPIGVVGVGSRWLKGGEDVWKSERGYLPFDVAPGQNVTLDVSLVAPDSPGNYILVLDLVSEFITWFGSNGGEAVTKNLEVISSS